MLPKPPRDMLRRFAFVSVIVFAGVLPGIRWLIHSGEGGFTVAPFLLGMAGWGLVSAIVWPPLILPLFWILHGIGWVNTRLLLGIIFYLVFTPLGLLLRLFGKDMLNRKLEPEAKTYWLDKEKQPFKPEDWERQF